MVRPTKGSKEAPTLQGHDGGHGGMRPATTAPVLNRLAIVVWCRSGFLEGLITIQFVFGSLASLHRIHFQKTVIKTEDPEAWRKGLKLIGCR